MPPTTSHQGRTLRRRVIWIAAPAALALGVVLFLRAGTLCVREDPLQPADAIFVLAGSSMLRPMEAVDLYRQGLAPVIVMTLDQPDAAERLLDERGIHYPDEAELARAAMLELGIPAAAMILPPTRHNNTAHEAHTLRLLALEHGWRRVIVVTSKYHTRRSGFAMRREMAGSGIAIALRASRYDDANPPRWWRQRRDLQDVPLEVAKLIAYALGLGM